MATPKKATGTKSTKKKTTQKKNSSPKKQTPKETAKQTLSITQKNPISDDVVLWTALALSILLFISDLGFGGMVGNSIGRFFFGLFGVLSYIFPFVLLGLTFFLISNSQNEIARAKGVSGIFLFFFLSALIELMARQAEVVSPSMAYLYGYENKSGGGFFGAMIAFALVKGFGLVGAYVIDVIACIIALVLITEKSVFRFLTNKNRHRRVRADMRRKERMAQRKKRKQKQEQEAGQRQAELKEFQKKPRRQRTANGVAHDTKLTAVTDTDNMSELGTGSEAMMSKVDSVNRVELTSQNPTASVIQSELEKKSEPVIHMVETPTISPVPEPVSVTEPQPEPIPEPVAEPEPAMEEASPAETESPVSRPRSTKETREQTKKEADEVLKEIQNDESKPKKEYIFPTTELLNPPKGGGNKNTKEYLQETAQKLEQTLSNFGVSVMVTDVSCGPAVTRYELQPEMGVKVSRITNLADDIKLNLAAADIRIEAPIPGKSAVGIEVPNKETVMVSIRELMESAEFKKSKSRIAFAAGRDIGGNVIISDIAKMPHLLIAGSTGSGKSVCINTIIMSILFKAAPDEVKLIMIDPKVVELSVYNGIPHLLIPVVTDPKKAAGALHWAVQEMTDRYKRFADVGVRDMAGYNTKIKKGMMEMNDGTKVAAKKMPQIVVIVDELADLMMVSSKEVEEAICRLAQLARAAGIHLIIATQRPSVNVITGLIKANMPSRVAFAVTSGVDSRTILDMNGAEKLLGKGDMLYYPQGFTKPLRVQGAFVSDEEVSKVVSFIKDQSDGSEAYDPEIQNHIDSATSSADAGMAAYGEDRDERDSYFADAGRLIIEKEKGSIGMLQRNFKIGFNRAARIMDQLEDAGVVGPEEGTKPRRVLLTISEFDEMVSGL